MRAPLKTALASWAPSINIIIIIIIIIIIKAVRRFCGFVNYLAKFMRKVSGVMELIRNLTCKENEWKWTHEHDAALKRIKQMATTSPLLRY